MFILKPNSEALKAKLAVQQKRVHFMRYLWQSDIATPALKKDALLNLKDALRSIETLQRRLGETS